MERFIGLAIITVKSHCRTRQCIITVDQQGHRYCRKRQLLCPHGLQDGPVQSEPIAGENLRPDGLFQCIAQPSTLLFEVTELAFLLQRNVPHKNTLLIT